MAFPDNSTEHLQDSVRRWFNREVREYFRDINIDDQWDPDLTQPRQSLAVACTHQEDDSLIHTLLRLRLFTEIRDQITRVPYYGIPVSSFDVERKHRPQIHLFFMEDLDDVEPGFEPVTGQISFRLMNETEETLNPVKSMQYANEIKNAFSISGGYRWHKGRVMCSYSDWNKGYQLQLLCFNKTEALQLIPKVLTIQDDTMDMSKFNVNENQAESEAFPIVPPTDFIYGKSRKRPRKRPIARVRYQYATLSMSGISEPIVLHDRSGAFVTAMVRD